MNLIATISVLSGIISSIIIGIDLIKHRQSMKIMNVVWVLTALWSGILGLIAYFWFGKEKKLHSNMSSSSEKMKDMPMSDRDDRKMQNMDMPTNASMHMQGMNMSDKTNMNGMMMMNRPKWQSISLSTLHCGAGCTLADLLGEWFLYFTALSIGGSLFLGSVVVDYILALCIGIYFQYAAIRSMSAISKTKAVEKAFKADILSLTAWQIGMYGFMAIAIFLIFPHEALSKTSWIFWCMMQIAMFAGFLIAYPANMALIKWGVKKAM